MKHSGKIIWWAILPIMVVIATWITLRNLDAFQLRTDTGYLSTVGQVGQAGWFRFGFFLHVFTAVPVIFLGWPQFSNWLQTQKPRLHRGMGKTYVALVLFGAAPGGFILALGAAGGWAGKACFVVMSALWFFFTLRAWLRIRRREVRGHQMDMQRSYALSFAAITLRIWMYAIGGLLEWRTPGAYALSAFLCWVPNIVLLEAWRKWVAK